MCSATSTAVRETEQSPGSSEHARDGTPVVEVNDATYEYAGGRKRTSRTIGPVSLSVGRGERIALIGRNGSGKSTLINLLSSASTPASGSVRWFGEGNPRRARGRIGVVFQSPALDALLTARETLAISARLLKMTRARADARTEELARLLGFADRLDDRIGTLSGGFVRRVDLARAIVHGPELLLLDEATSGLDDASAAAFNDMLDRLIHEGVTIIAATHTVDEVRHATRVIAMEGGRVRVDRPALSSSVEHRPRPIRVARASDSTAERLRDLGLQVSNDGDAEVDVAGLPDDALGSLIRAVSAKGGVLSMGDATMDDYLSTGNESAWASPPANQEESP